MASSVPLKMVTLLLTLLLLCYTCDAAAPFGMQQYEGYEEGVMIFNGSIYGHPIEANGTIQEVFAQFTHKHPEVELEFKTNATAAGPQVKRRAIQPREPDNKSGLQCCPISAWNWKGANQLIIEDGIEYLDNVQARCGVGPRTCVRVSCSWDAAIYLCNDNDYDIFPACPYIASYAQDLSERCWGFWNGVEVVCGQEFDTDNYNIIVRYEEKRC